MNRRDFLTGYFGPRRDSIRPPGALPGDEFTAACSRCAACTEACPEHIIVRGSGRFPEINFSQGGCTFCNACAAACPDGALVEFDTDTVPWDLKAGIGDTCLAVNAVTCRVCGDACTSAAIRFKLQPGGVVRPQINSKTCTGCGECVAVCPVQSITMHRQSPAIANGDTPCPSSTSVAC